MTSRVTYQGNVYDLNSLIMKAGGGAHETVDFTILTGVNEAFESDKTDCFVVTPQGELLNVIVKPKNFDSNTSKVRVKILSKVAMKGLRNPDANVVELGQQQPSKFGGARYDVRNNQFSPKRFSNKFR